MKWKIAGIIAAATVGDGIFALPFVFYQSGWLIGLVYLAVLGAIVISAHIVYLKTLEKVGEKQRLLGLAKRYLGAGGFWIGFAAIVVGLLLTLVAYLILGSQFIKLGFPNALPGIPLAAFWVFMAGIALIGDTRIRELELAGILFTTVVIVLVFLTAFPTIGFGTAPTANVQNLFLPFGAVLFSLAGWTGIEPAYESRKGGHGKRKTDPWRGLLMGTTFAALLYIMFVAGILGSISHLTPDTISGLGDWPLWKRDIIAALGFFAVATVTMPISREIKNALEKDLKWNKFASRALIIFFPIICLLLGLNNFLVVVGIVGGVFLSTQYLLIVSVGRRALKLSLAQKVLLDTIAVIFIAAAVYEVLGFIVK